MTIKNKQIKFPGVRQALNLAMRRFSLLIAKNQAIPDSLEEEIHRLELAVNPENWKSTCKLVAVIFRQQRLPIPELTQTGTDCELREEEQVEIQRLDLLARDAAINGDTLTVFAAAWAIHYRFPHSTYGLARLCAILAERGYFDDAFKVLQDVLARQPLTDLTCRTLAEAASIIAEYQPWLAKELLSCLRTALISSVFSTDAYVLEVARIAGETVSDTPKIMIQCLDDLSPKEMRLMAKHFFSVNRFQDAYDLFFRAIQLDQGESVRDILRNFGGPFGHLLSSLGKEAEINHLLDSLYDGDCNLVSAWHSPESILDIRRVRDMAIDRQLPSVLLVTPGKCGSVAVGNILSSGFNLPTMATAIATNNVILAWATAFAGGGVMHTSQISATPDNVRRLSEAGVKRVILHVRDPRQIILSLAHHLAKYKEQFGSIKGFSEIIEKSSEERIDFLIREQLPYIATWLKRWFGARDLMEIRFTTYEMFVSDRDRFLEELLQHYGGDTRFFSKANAMSASGVDGHFRKGAIDEWRSVLTKKQIIEANHVIGDEILANFGWH